MGDIRKRIEKILKRYSLKTNERTLDRFIYLLSVLDESDLTDQLLENLIIENLTIGESYFFRDRETFDKLKTIFKSRPSWKILSIGCAKGEEVYSTAITAQQAGVDYQIIGIDVNVQRIFEAQSGCYRFWSVRLLNEHEISNYFILKDNMYCIKEAYKKNVTFLNGNIAEYDFGITEKFDIIFLRRVLIYLDNVEDIIRKVLSILKDDGYLIIGNGEYFPPLYEYFEPISPDSMAIMKKKARTFLLDTSISTNNTSSSQPNRTRRVLSATNTYMSEKARKNSVPAFKNMINDLHSNLSFEEELSLVENYISQGKFNESYERLNVLSVKYPSQYVVWKYKALVELELLLKDKARESLKRALFLNHVDEEIWQLKNFIELR